MKNLLWLLALVVALALSGCKGGGVLLGPDPPDDDDDSSEDDDDSVADDDDTSVGPDCDALNPLPAEFNEFSGITSAEDFVFDLEGYVVSVDPQGNLVRSTKEGETSLVVPGIVSDSAGISMLADGRIVVADPAAGALVIVTPEGSATTLLSGLSYPNGVEIHQDGWIAVAEHDAGVIRRVDPDTGEFVILADGLMNPNGVTFSPDGGTLYVGSFGGGTVHAIELDESGSVGEPVLFAEINGGGEATELPWGSDPWTDACDDLEQGDACTLIDQPGTCANWGGGQLYCDAPDPFEQACNGAQVGDPCTLLTETGTCEDWGWGLQCDNPAWWEGWGEGGGLDGIAVDACGNVYVTEYVLGLVWRVTEAGAEPELVAELPSYWIPNMDFGMGYGGWDETRLWVVDRETNMIYGIDIGIRGRPLAHE
jgi:sugar lactone lactonase YvrE